MQRTARVPRPGQPVDQHRKTRAVRGRNPRAVELELDCSGVSAADSAGLAVLVDWLAWARHAGRTLHLRGVPAKLIDIARISELDTLLVPG